MPDPGQDEVDSKYSWTVSKLFAIPDDLSWLDALVEFLHADRSWLLHRASPEGRLAHGIYVLLGAIENGALEDYLDVESANFSIELLLMLRQLGLNEAAYLLEQIAGFFPNSIIPADINQRREEMDRLRRRDSRFGEFMERATSQYRKSGENMVPVLRRYMASKKDMLRSYERMSDKPLLQSDPKPKPGN